MYGPKTLPWVEGDDGIEGWSMSGCELFSADETSSVGDVMNAVVEESLCVIPKLEIWYGHSGLGWYPVDELELERECRLDNPENWCRVGEGTGEGIEHVDEDA